MADRSRFDTARHLLQTSTERRLFPAYSAEVGSSDDVLWREAGGHLTFDVGTPATSETIFDLASLTKPMATTSVVLHAIDRGRISLDRTLRTLFDDWRGDDRSRVTIQDLLEHAGGLSARLVDRPPDTARDFEHEICTMPLEYEPRTRSLYTDLGFILLAFACERVEQRPFADLAADLLQTCVAAGMRGNDTAELLTAVAVADRVRTAPTTPLIEDRRRGRMLVGDVHDNYAAALGGFAGHAGLFGTAPGVGAFARVMLRAVRGDRSMPPPFTPAMARRAVTRSNVPGSSRALGWDTMRSTSSCGSHLSLEAFGHVGFTGTSLWIDPTHDRYYVLLTNRVCNGGTSDEMQAIRRSFHDIVAA
ncbi:MAG: serine hydrolase domain-containing protein [Vicinamibacterales bacterium]